MEHKRIRKKNEFITEIQLLKKYIEKHTKMIQIYDSSTLEQDLRLQKISELKTLINNNKSKINELSNCISKITKGELDEDIMNEYTEGKCNTIENMKKHKNKKKKIIEEKKIKKDKLSKQWKDIKSERYKEKQKRREIFNTYRYYKKIYSYIPMYILNNLKKMPNNKGYIYNNIYLFGEMDREYGQPNIMFEKKKKELYIHEWRDNYYKIFLKQRNRRNILVHKETRKIKHIEW